MKTLVSKREVMSKEWRIIFPKNCPVVLRDGENKRVGACWYYLWGGECLSHGKIYENEKEDDDGENKSV